jgi:hypothetical protein
LINNDDFLFNLVEGNGKKKKERKKENRKNERPEVVTDLGEQLNCASVSLSHCTDFKKTGHVKKQLEGSLIVKKREPLHIEMGLPNRTARDDASEVQKITTVTQPKFKPK